MIDGTGMDTTGGHLLNGRVSYAQPAEGFRSGIEPVLLAAAIAARPGERVLEAGSGAGAAMLCLAARVPGIAGVGIEQDPALAAIATGNAAANGWAAALEFQAADITRLPDIGVFDHAFANPPYHPAASTASPDPRRDQARRAPAALFAAWGEAMGRLLRRRGSLTWVVSAACVPACLAAMADAQCQPSAMLPLWPRAGMAAKLVLLRGIKQGRGPFRVASGLPLHDGTGRFTPEADAILRDGHALGW